MLSGLLLPLVLLLLAHPAAAVDRSKFRTCKDTGFCKRYRDHKPASHVSCVVVCLLPARGPHARPLPPPPRG